MLIFLFCVVFLGGETHPGELYCFTRTQAAGGSRGAGFQNVFGSRALRVSKPLGGWRVLFEAIAHPIYTPSPPLIGLDNDQHL